MYIYDTCIYIRCIYTGNRFDADLMPKKKISQSGTLVYVYMYTLRNIYIYTHTGNRFDVAAERAALPGPGQYDESNRHTFV